MAAPPERCSPRKALAQMRIGKPKSAIAPAALVNHGHAEKFVDGDAQVVDDASQRSLVNFTMTRNDQMFRHAGFVEDHMVSALPALFPAQLPRNGHNFAPRKTSKATHLNGGD